MGHKPVKITVLGSYNQDLVMYSPSFPHPKETLTTGTFAMFPGGKGANQAHAAGRAGGDITFIGKIGSDMFGDQAIMHLQNANVHTSYLIRDSQYQTGCASIFVEQKTGQNMILVASGANVQITNSNIDEAKDAIVDANLFLTQFETNLSAIKHAMEIAVNAKVPVCLNPAPALTPFPKEIFPLLSIIAPNEVEAGAIVGYQINSIMKAKQAAQDLITMGPQIGIITLGDQGVVAATNTEIIHIPAFSVNVVDTVGAGDTFIGTFAVAWTESHNLKKSLYFASAAASIKVTRKGASIANPNRQEIDLFLQTNSFQ
jgi:ribokinase